MAYSIITGEITLKTVHDWSVIAISGLKTLARYFLLPKNVTVAIKLRELKQNNKKCQVVQLRGKNPFRHFVLLTPLYVL